MLVFYYPFYFLFGSFSLFLFLYVFFKGFSSRFYKIIMRCDLVLYFWISVLIFIFSFLLYIKLPTTLIISNMYFSLFFSNFSLFFVLVFNLVVLLLLVSFWKDSWLFIQQGFLLLIFTQILFGAFSVLVFANDLFLLFLALELINMVLFIFFSFRKYLEVFLEALLKLFWLNTLSASFFLVGLVFIYYSCGSLLLSDFEFFFSTLFLKTNIVSAGIIEFPFVSSTIFQPFLMLATPDVFFVFLGSLFFFFALSIKLGIFPFHNWVVDVVQGCPFNFLPFYYLISKLVYFFIFIKVFRILLLFFNYFTLVGVFFLILSLFSIFYLLFLNLHQLTLKRLFALSGIVQYGYILFILTVFTHSSLVFAFLLFFFYLLNSFTLFFALASSRKIYDFRCCHKLNELHIFSNSSNSLVRIYLTTLFFILVGVPPFIGFIFKLVSSVFFGYLQDSSLFLSVFILLLLSSIVSFIYVRCLIFLNTITVNYLPVNFFDLCFWDVVVLYLVLFGNIIFICYLPLILELSISLFFFSF